MKNGIRENVGDNANIVPWALHRHCFVQPVRFFTAFRMTKGCLNDKMTQRRGGVPPPPVLVAQISVLLPICRGWRPPTARFLQHHFKNFMHKKFSLQTYRENWKHIFILYILLVCLTRGILKLKSYLFCLLYQPFTP